MFPGDQFVFRNSILWILQPSAISQNRGIFFFSGLLIHLFLKLTTFSSLFHPTTRLKSLHSSTAFLEAGSLTLHFRQRQSLPQRGLPWHSTYDPSLFQPHPYTNFGCLLHLCDWKITHESLTVWINSRFPLGFKLLQTGTMGLWGGCLFCVHNFIRV